MFNDGPLFSPGIVDKNTLCGQDYGIVANGVTDDTAAFNEFMAACKSGQLKGTLPKGTIRLASKPNDIDFKWDLGGVGIVSTVLLRDYSEAAAQGCLALVANSSGTRIHDLSIQSASGTTGGNMISAVSTASFAISGIIFENLWLTTQGSNTHTNTIYFDGMAKTSAPTGIRDISLKNIHVFGANGFSAKLMGIIGLCWFGGGAYVAGGTNANSGGVQIGGTAAVKSNYITMDIANCGGFNLSQCSDMKLASASIGALSGISVNNDNTCNFIQVIGRTLGTVLGNWTNSGVRRPNAAYSST